MNHSTLCQEGGIGSQTFVICFHNLLDFALYFIQEMTLVHPTSVFDSLGVKSGRRWVSIWLFERKQIKAKHRMLKYSLNIFGKKGEQSLWLVGQPAFRDFMHCVADDRYLTGIAEPTTPL